MALGLAPEGAALVLGLVAVGLLGLGAGIALSRWPVWLVGAATLVLAAATAFLFRDPPRSVTIDPTAVLAPADGRVVSVDSVPGEAYLGGPARRITLRSSLLDVHVLRSPVDGVVDYTERADSRGRLGLSTGSLRVLLALDGGAAVPVADGALLDQGQRAGILPAGGPVVVLLPADAAVRVIPGQRVRAGHTILARAGGAS